MDKIIISNLAVNAVIGTLPEERRHRQRLIFDLELRTDMRAAAAGDALEYAVDYSEVERRVEKLAFESNFLLIETLAERVAALLLGFAAVRGCRVRVSKPGASNFGAAIAVEIDRGEA